MKEPLKLYEELGKMRTFLVILGDSIKREMDQQEASGIRNPFKLSALIKDIGKIVLAIAEVAKTARQIEKGILIKIDAPSGFLNLYLQQVILVEVRDAETRRRILERSEKFLNARMSPGLSITDVPALLDGEEPVEDTSMAEDFDG